MPLDYADYVNSQEHWLELPSYPLDHEFDLDEYQLRMRRARTLMAAHQIDALVITSGLIGQWFTSLAEPHEWHDRCQSRSAWYILTDVDDYLLMTPTTAGEHMNTTRRSTWVSHILPIVERAQWPRVELWDLAQMPQIFARLGLTRARLGFELGDCMTVGLSVNDVLALRELMSEAHIVDASVVVRQLMSVHTPLEIERLRTACQAGIWMHNQVPDVLQAGMTERDFQRAMNARFESHFGAGYTYQANTGWDVRNRRAGDSNVFHGVTTNRVFKDGDFVSRGHSGLSYRGYAADVDRSWHIGRPSADVLKYFRITWECNQAMAETIKPGVRCSDVYAACIKVERQHGLPERRTGRVGHGFRNTGGLSVHPDNHTVLEPNMVISVEPMFATEDGWFDLEDQYVVTQTGRDILHPVASPDLPTIPVRPE